MLNDLELIFHLDAPCQYKSIDAKAQKNSLYPMPAVCFVYRELCVIFHCSQGFFYLSGVAFLFGFFFLLFGFEFGWFAVFVGDVAFLWENAKLLFLFPSLVNYN